MVDKIINTVAIIAIVAVFVGLLIAIWFGNIGVKITCTGAVIFAADWLLFLWFKEMKKESSGRND